MRRNIISGFLYVASSKVGMLLASVVITPALVRLLGRNNYGDYAFALSIFSLTVIFTSSGIQTGVRKYVAEDRDVDGWQSDVFVFYLRVACVLALVGALTLLALLEFGILGALVGDEIGTYLYVVVILVPAHQLFTLCRSGLMGLGLEKYSEPLRVVERIVFGVTAVGLTYASYGVTGALFGRFFALTFVGLAGLVIIVSQFGLGGLLDRTVPNLPRRDLLEYNWFSTGLGFLTASLYHTDVILIQSFTASGETGLYKSALVVTSFLLFVPEAVQIVLLHSTSELWRDGLRERISDIASQVVRFTFAGTLLLALGLSALAEPFVILYFGESFRQAVRPLLWLLPGTVGFAIARPIYAIGQGKGDLRPLVLATGGAAVINLGLNLVLIPQYGIEGAAIATTVGYGSMLVFHALAAYRIGFAPLRDFRVGRITVSGLIAALPIHALAALIKDPVVSLFVIPPLGCAVYVTAVIMTGAVTLTELTELKHQVGL